MPVTLPHAEFVHLLHAARVRGARGRSTTRAGTLLKQQIPIRSSFQWNEAKPGFLEGDLVAHNGKGLEGTFLYMLTLTDVATGWTECLPVLGRSRELVLAAFQHACPLFPFPILGLDTDCGGEFLNEDMVGYCEREQIMLTRGRPSLENDQAHVEQKNGNIVRQGIGYDRYDGEYASQQIAELYRAWRLYVNCFQPSMKLVVSEEMEASIARHDPAKTPLQRVLLSGILAADQEQEWLALSRAIDPARLLNQVEHLQQAVFRSAVGVTPFPHRQPAATVLRFYEHLCQTEPFSRNQERPVEREPLLPEQRETIDPLAWPRTRRDPFRGEWEYISFCLQARPELTAGVLLRHLQRRTPERYHAGHLRSLQRAPSPERYHAGHLRSLQRAPSPANVPGRYGQARSLRGDGLGCRSAATIAQITGRVKHPQITDPSVQPVSSMGTRAALRFPPLAPRVHLMYSGRISCNGWRLSVKLRSSYATPIMLRLGG